MPRARRAPALPPMPPDNDLGARVEAVLMRPPRGEKAAEQWVTPLQAQRLPGWREAARREIGARAGEPSTTEAVPDDANGRRRRRGTHAIEMMHRQKRLTTQQAAAGEALSIAWEATQRSPSVDLSEERVDRSPRPDERATVLIEAQTRYGRLMKHVPVDCRGVVMRVACEGRVIAAGGGVQHRTAMHRLHRGLDALADHLGVGRS